MQKKSKPKRRGSYGSYGRRPGSSYSSSYNSSYKSSSTYNSSYNSKAPRYSSAPARQFSAPRFQQTDRPAGTAYSRNGDVAPSATIEEHFLKVKQAKELAKQEPVNSSQRPRSPLHQLAASRRTASPQYRSNGDPVPSATIEEHFDKVRQAKELARHDSSSQRSQTPPSAPSCWSGEAFVNSWQSQQAHEGDCRRVYVPGGLSSSDSDDSFYERFRDDDDDINLGSPKSASKPTEVSPKAAPKPSSVSYEPSDTVNEKLKANLRSLIKLNPGGIWACSLPEKYRESFKLSLNWNELGYDSVVQMAHDLSDVFICKRVNNGDWRLFDASLPLPAEYSNEKPKSNPLVPDLVKNKIYNIVKKFRTGIRAEQVPQLYEEHYGRSLCSEAPGFDSPESLLSSLNGTVVCLRYVRKECFVYPGQSPPQTSLPILEIKDTNIKKELGLYPDEVLGPEETYFSPELPENLGMGDYIELRVAEVYNPHKFWIMIRQYAQHLDQLMDELQDFYRDHGDKYKMHASTVTEGQCCVATYQGEWHRVTIKSVASEVEVFYVDYGTVAQVPLHELRYIHRDFCNLPAQAIRASMSGIKPSHGRQRFTREANQELLRLVIDKALIGLIQRVEPEEPFLELFLIDTNGDNDIHLNDVLVTLNHAVFKSDPEGTTGEGAEVTSEAAEVTPEAVNETVHNAHSGASSSHPEQATSDLQSSRAPSVPPGFAAPYGAAFDPIMNPALAAYSAACSTPAAALLLQQQLQYQQQQQTMLLALYQNMYQQAAASLVAQLAQTKAAWQGLQQPGGATNSQPPEAVDPKKMTSPVARKSSPVLSSSEESDFSDRPTPRKKKIRRKKSDRPTTPSTPVKKSMLSELSSLSSSEGINDVVVERLDELLEVSDDSSSSDHNNAPDIVQSVASLNLSRKSCVTNFWKIVDVSGKSIHLFNIDGKPFVSTGELARNFTTFSTGDTLVRVLKNKDISAPYKKLTRQEELPMFSALDGHVEEYVKNFDLSRNRNGSVIGSFHLTPLGNIPVMLITVGAEVAVVKGFQKLRDLFNPNDSYWTQ